jgi:hypothetical protein
MSRNRETGPDAARRTLLLLALCAPAAGLASESASLIGRIRQLLEYPPRRGGRPLALAKEIVFGASNAVATGTIWSEAQLASTIRANIAADYLAGRIVDENFWQISATEARALELMRCLASA